MIIGVFMCQFVLRYVLYSESIPNRFISIGMSNNNSYKIDEDNYVSNLGVRFDNIWNSLTALFEGFSSKC